jgi:antitoxin protein of toxin-antitoxin system
VGSGERFNELKDKAKDKLGQHGDKVDRGVDKARDMADERTGGKYSDQLDKGAEQAKQRFGEQNQ